MNAVLLRPACVSLVDGDVVVGLLLSQIAYWCAPDARGQSKLRVWRKGVQWIAKTRQEWLGETGLTLQQYRRAIRILKDKGLVEVRVMRFRGLTQSHLRILRPIAHFLGVKPPSHANTPSRRGVSPPCDRTTYTTDRGIEEKSTKRSCGLPSARAGSTEIISGIRGRAVEREEEQEKAIDVREEGTVFFKDEIATALGLVAVCGCEGTPPLRREALHALMPKPTAVVQPTVVVTPTAVAKSTGMRGFFMKAADILKHYQTPANGSLSAYWKSRLAHVQPGYQQALTSKERGQLKQLSKKLGNDTRPVIAYAVEHWVRFASRAGDIAGTGMFPPEPHIGFLLKYHGVAMNLLHPVAPPPPVREARVQLIATGLEKEPVYKPTPEEWVALRLGLKTP